MKRVYLGHVGVDSGQLMITDPCYVRHFDNNEFKDIRVYQHKDDPNKTLQFGIDFKNYQDMIEGHAGQCMNQLLSDGIYVESPKKSDDSFSYNGACTTTLESFGGTLQNGMAAVFQSGFGDGSYDVHAYVDEIDGWGERVTKVEITLIEEEA